MIRPGPAPIGTAVLDKEMLKLVPVWQQWFVNTAALFSKSGQLVAVIVGPSPFVYQNPNSYLEQVLIDGGAVSNVEFSRDGVNFYSVASNTNVAVLLSGADRVRITYTAPPTMQIAPL